MQIGWIGKMLALGVHAILVVFALIPASTGEISGMNMGVAAPVVDLSSTPNELAKRKAAELRTLSQFKVFHNFSFTDERASSGITFVNKPVPLYGFAQYDHGSGLAVADVDGDGLPDVYFLTEEGENELWKNEGHGKFRNITTKGLAMENMLSFGASFADFDNNGTEDLIVTTAGSGVRLFKNNGKGVFTDVTQAAHLPRTGNFSGALWFDYDRDGRLDLLLTNMGDFTDSQSAPEGFKMPLIGAPEIYTRPQFTGGVLLYHNNGDGTFTNVTSQVGLNVAPLWSGDATFSDVNGDGYPDLYVLNMFGDDRYFENEQGKKFVDQTAQVFGKTPWGSMGVKFFDFNNDGQLDLYVTDMHSDMRGPLPPSREKQKSDLSFFAPAKNNIWGNAFYESVGTSTYREASDALGLETYWPWGVSVGDVNADGYQDVFIAGGMGGPQYRYGSNSMLLNNLGEKFLDSEFILGIEPRANGAYETPWVTNPCLPGELEGEVCQGWQSNLEGSLSSRSSAIFDLDGDGDLDIVTNDFHGPPQVLVSNLAQVKQIHYMEIMLHGTRSNRDGLGAVVRVSAGGKWYVQQYDGKSGYLSMSHLPLYFGLGDAAVVDRIEILWPSGMRQVVNGPFTANQLMTITETP